MTILFVGAEQCDTAYVYGNAFDTSTSSAFRSAYARGCFSGWGTEPAGDPNPARVTFVKWSAPVSSFWVSFRYLALNQSYGNNIQAFNFRDSAGTLRLSIRLASTSTFKLTKRNAAGTLTDVGTFVGPTSYLPALTKIDIYVNYSSSGSVSIYQNGMLQGTVSGDLLTDSATQLQQFEVCNLSFYSSEKTFVSEVIGATTSTKSMSLATLTSSTAGAAQQWTGTATNVNQIGTPNDANYIYSATADQVQQYKPAAAPSGPFAVAAVVTSARALVGTTGPQHVAAVTRVGSTDYVSADYSPLNAFGSVQHIEDTNPSTSSAWGLSDLAPTNLQYGVKSKA